MKYLSIKDNKKRFLTKQLEQKKKILKSIIFNMNLPVSVRWNAYIKLIKLSISGSKIQLVSRCVLTGRKNSIRHLKISRIMFKNLAQKGMLTGFQKINW